ncbi:hypothetical protein CEUSTIGMA_g9663.t1 [Chlamydomonas eustigma]|uniref:Very-long-chain (3R)-3-hydroxyacyl-CoA dehydratase n=1 Tax=Chlamydomonas eustigma TaxID=1157962 RepID=A0A250XGM8_9CHLO|nr:hypothetical protein CEUSTIGMA_g9663.t1 [Chlamydomonas eustigma]|eukprot:GAX82235.1 hypothetical protein CEUSTIGMA_g9663.t1 [Chlamydomonas eustigma]
MRSRASATLTCYLFVYNIAQATGWSLCLVSLLIAMSQGAGPQVLIQESGKFVRVFQLASAMEILHAAIKIVPSSAVLAFMQWAGRSHVLLAILLSVPEVQKHAFGPLMLAVWAASEVIRYPWYALNSIDICPQALTWLRYTAFIPLYPVGVVCEMALMALALPYLKEDGRWSIGMPNKANIAFEYSTFIQALLVCYPFLWWGLYSSLLRQRNKKLGKMMKSD